MSKESAAATAEAPVPAAMFANVHTHVGEIVGRAVEKAKAAKGAHVANYGEQTKNKDGVLEGVAFDMHSAAWEAVKSETASEAQQSALRDAIYADVLRSLELKEE